MPSSERNPRTHMPIADLREYKRVVCEIAGLTAYSMDDPERPFTSEYGDGGSSDVYPTVNQISIPDVDGEVKASQGAGVVERLQDQVERMRSVALSAGKGAVDSAGQTRLFSDVEVAPAPDEVIHEKTMRGRGGQLLTRLSIGTGSNERYIFVPVEEGGRSSHADALRNARTRLVEGGGMRVRNRQGPRS